MKKISIILAILSLFLVVGVTSQLLSIAVPIRNVTENTTEATETEATTTEAPLTEDPFLATVNPEGFIRNPANLIDPTHYEDLDGQTLAGVKITVLDQGEIVLNGTSIGGFSFEIDEFQDEYLASDSDTGYAFLGDFCEDITQMLDFPGTQSTCYIALQDSQSVFPKLWHNGSSYYEYFPTQICSGGETQHLTFVVTEAGITFDHVVLRPMLYYANVTQDGFADGFSYYGENTYDEESLTDLTNTTWYVPSGWKCPSRFELVNYLDSSLTIDGEEYWSAIFGAERLVSDDGDISERTDAGFITLINFACFPSTVLHTDYAFTISFGNNFYEATNSDLIAWLLKYGIQLKVTDLTDTTWTVNAGWEAEKMYGKFEVDATFQDGNTFSNFDVGYGFSEDPLGIPRYDAIANWISCGEDTLGVTLNAFNQLYTDGMVIGENGLRVSDADGVRSNFAYGLVPFTKD